MKKYILFSVICAVACWSNSFAQYPDWINYTSGQGVYALADNGGGLAKFDGSNWTVYNPSNSGLPGNAVIALAIDGSDNIWIGTGGLVKFDGTNWTVYNTSNSDLPDNEVLALAIDGSNIWIGTWLGGLAVYTGEQGIDNATTTDDEEAGKKGGCFIATERPMAPRYILM